MTSKTSLVPGLGVGQYSMAAAEPAGAAEPPEDCCDQDVFLPPTYVVRRRHVEAALRGVPSVARNVTVWVHSSTLGIGSGCFRALGYGGAQGVRVCRVFVCRPPPEVHQRASAAALGVFIARLRAHEPDIVDDIRDLARHDADDLYSVGQSAFECCSALKELVLPSCIAHISSGALGYCESLTSVTLPNSLTHIGERAFIGCRALTSMTLPNLLTHIGERAFMGCTSLKTVVLPKSITSIDSCAFEGCVSLKSVKLPRSITHIGADAFPKETFISGSKQCTIA